MFITKPTEVFIIHSIYETLPDEERWNVIRLDPIGGTPLCALPDLWRLEPRSGYAKLSEAILADR
jgi:hypothetical protein